MDPIIIKPENQRNLTKEVVDFAFEQAEKRLDKQMESFDKVVGRNITILRWLLIGVCSLLGVIVADVSSPSPNMLVLWMSIYGLAAMLLTAVVLVLTGLFNKNMSTSGSGPSTLLYKGRLEDMTQDGREDKLYALKEFHLEYLDSIINDNRTVHKKVVRAYRRAVIMIVVEVCFGLLLFAFLLFELNLL